MKLFSNQAGQLSNLKCGPLDLLVLQSTPFCNLDCSYCYLPDRNNKHTMADKVIDKIFERLKQSTIVGNHFTVVWHAGEPLAAGIDYYRKAVDLINRIKPDGTRVNFSFQTNGSLINPEWCEFFLEHAVNVGVSVDGPDFIHDRYRKYRSGKGSHEAVQNGMDCLKQHKVPFHTISVLSEDSLDHAQAIFDYFHGQGINRCGFNIEEIESINISSSLQSSSANERVKQFFRTLMMLNLKHGEPMIIRELQKAVSIITNWDRDKLDWLGSSQELVPYKIISVDYNGNFSTFSPELISNDSNKGDRFIFGNVFKQSFEKAIQSQAFRQVYDSIQSGIEKCRANCEYYKFCGGGSPSNKYYENGTFDCDETMYCRLHRKIPFDVALEFMEYRAKQNTGQA